MYIGPWQEFQLAQEGNKATAPSAPSGQVLDNVRKILEDAASCGDFDPEAVAKLGLLLAANSNNPKKNIGQRPDSASSRASVSSRASTNSAYSNASSRMSQSSFASSARRNHRNPSSERRSNGGGSWAHKGIRRPQRDKIVNGIRIKTGGNGNYNNESGDRAAAESVALRVQSVGDAPNWSPHSARSENHVHNEQTPRSRTHSRRSNVSAPAAAQSQTLMSTNKPATPQKQHNSSHLVVDRTEQESASGHNGKNVTSLLKAERRNRFHSQRSDLDSLWGGKWKDKQATKQNKPKTPAKAKANKTQESGAAAVNAMKAIYLDALHKNPTTSEDHINDTDKNDFDTNDEGFSHNTAQLSQGHDREAALKMNTGPSSKSSKDVVFDQGQTRQMEPGTQPKPKVADIKLTNDHINLVAKYFEDDALQLLTKTLDSNSYLTSPHPSHSPVYNNNHQENNETVPPSTNMYSSSSSALDQSCSLQRSGRISPVQTTSQRHHHHHPTPLTISTSLPSDQTAPLPSSLSTGRRRRDSERIPTPTSKVGTPMTGEAGRYQSVDALLDWAKDLEVDDDFLDRF